MASVTIGLPVYNGAEYLNDALSAICSQSFKDFQIIISDNASTDSTPVIIEQWVTREPRIVLAYRQPSNIGARRNFEWILEKTETPWIAFAAHDDQWSANYLECLHAAITNKQNVAISVPQIVYTRSDGVELRRRPLNEALLHQRDLVKCVRTLLQKACGSWFYGLHCSESLKTAWKRTCNYNFIWGFDLLILLPLLLTGSIAGNNNALYFSRETGLSIEHYKPKTLSDQKRLYLSFLKHSIKSLSEASLSNTQKILLLPTIMRYTSSHGFKLRRLARTAFRAIYDKSVR